VSKQHPQLKEFPRAMIFDIERHALHDGPGIRTLVFLKGCNIQCKWCSNPEGQNMTKDLMLYRDKCTMCLKCADTCPEKAISESGNEVVTDRLLCTVCGVCVDVCPSGARKIVGREMGADEVFEIIKKDDIFYRYSEGGITISGGEPLLFPVFLDSLFRLCRQQGIHTAVETCGYVPWQNIKDLSPRINLFLYDLKHMDQDKHNKFIGTGNKLILENLVKLDKLNPQLIIRIPVIPGFNDTVSEINEILNFIYTLKHVQEVHLLPYHNLGKSKYAALNIPYPMIDRNPISMKKIHTLRDELQEEELKIVIDV